MKIHSIVIFVVAVLLPAHLVFSQEKRSKTTWTEVAGKAADSRVSAVVNALKLEGQAEIAAELESHYKKARMKESFNEQLTNELKVLTLLKSPGVNTNLLQYSDSTTITFDQISGEELKTVVSSISKKDDEHKAFWPFIGGGTGAPGSGGGIICRLFPRLCSTNGEKIPDEKILKESSRQVRSALTFVREIDSETDEIKFGVKEIQRRARRDNATQSLFEAAVRISVTPYWEKAGVETEKDYLQLMKKYPLRKNLRYMKVQNVIIQNQIRFSPAAKEILDSVPIAINAEVDKEL